MSLRIRLSLLPLFSLLLAFSSGCVTSKGVLYLQTETVQDYLAKEQRPAPTTPEKTLAEKGIEEARKTLRDVPDGDRILGGLCTETDIKQELQAIVDRAPTCRKRQQSHQTRGNTYAIVFWSLIGGTAATGAAMLIAGIAAIPNPSTTAAAPGLALGFGIPMFLAALTTQIAPFRRWQLESQEIAIRLDNYLWTLRKRISIEVCNAPNRQTALDALRFIASTMDASCRDEKEDDGLYRPK